MPLSGPQSTNIYLYANESFIKIRVWVELGLIQDKEKKTHLCLDLCIIKI